MCRRLQQVSLQIHSLSRSNSNQAADQLRVCQVDMQKLEQFPIPNDVYAKFFCNGMLLVGIDSFDFAIFSKQIPSLLTIPLGIWSIIIAIFAAFTIIAASCPRFPVHNLSLSKVKYSHMLYPFRFFRASGLSARIAPTVRHFSSSSQSPQVSTPFFSAY